MALVRGSATDLLAEAKGERLHVLLREQAGFQLESRVAPSEVRSWQRSLPVLLTDLVDAGLGDVEVLLEYKLPHISKRVDVVLCGIHPRTHDASYVLVELKQWSRAEVMAAELVTIDAHSDPLLHPVEQVRRYCQYLADSTPALADTPHALHGLAYLHNANNSGVSSLMNYEPTEFGTLFTMDDKASMLDRLRSLLSVDAGRDNAHRAADEFLDFRHRPTKQLLSIAAEEVREREQFTLLDEQQVAFDLVMHAVEHARTARTQTVVIVLGGPGSGKSAIALSLLGELSRKQRSVHHATGSNSYTNTMRKVAGHRNKRVQSLFKYFNNYMEAEQRGLDVLICDEAHRIREKSVNRYTSREKRERAGRQINELIDAAHVPVFLLDENQTVRPGEMGSRAEITAAAEALGCRVEVVRLGGQYRCGGSVNFDTWVERLLGLQRLPPIEWGKLTAASDEEFVLTSAASPTAIESWLSNQAATHGGTARLAAGFCWPWSDPVDTAEGRTLVSDVTIGDWARPWNAKPGKRVPEAPESYYWASDERGFDQVGCIYTAQGFEYDWAGIIFGPDFVWRTDRWFTRPEYSHDPALKRANETEFQALTRNTYKVLLTRGMRGACLYSTDPETQEFLDRMTS